VTFTATDSLGARSTFSTKINVATC
jgi:hypothetical protein